MFTVRPLGKRVHEVCADFAPTDSVTHYLMSNHRLMCFLGGVVLGSTIASSFTIFLLS